MVAATGRDVWIEDTEGRQYLDFTSGIGVTNTGHCHPTVVAAAKKQIDRIIHAQYTTVLHQPLLELTSRLGEKMPSGLDRAFFASAGTEAVEAGIRLARQATGRTNIVAFTGGFHGRTVGSLSLTSSNTAYRAGLQPLMGGVFFSPYPYGYRLGLSEDEATRYALRELDEIFATQTDPVETAAFIVEPVLGEGGYVPSTAGFLEGLRERADACGSLLIFDEIQSGFGRSGRFWAHQHTEASPDVLITAKGLASGFPLSSMWAPEEIMAKAWPGSQGGTYGGNAVACAAAIATLDVIESEHLVERAADRGDYLLARLKELAAGFPQIGDVRGRGLMVATEFVDQGGVADRSTAAAVRQGMEHRKVLMLTCGPRGNVLRWIPPLTVTREHIDTALDAFRRSLELVLEPGEGSRS
ncbi:MAG: aspartate aminotransferase family protein, partial [Acidimicrobiia bacterium]